MARYDEYTFDSDRQRKRIGAKRDLDGNLVKQENIPIGGAPRERTDFASALQPKLGTEVESSATRAKRESAIASTPATAFGPRSGETMGPPSPQSFTRMGGEIAGPSQNGQPLGEINVAKIDPKYRVPGGPSVGTATFAPSSQPRTAFIGDETGDRTKEFVRPQPQMIAPAVQPAAPVAKAAVAAPVATPAATPTQSLPVATSSRPSTPETPSFLDRGKAMVGNAAQSFSNFAGQAKSAVIGGATAAAATAIPKVQSFIRNPVQSAIGQANENVATLGNLANKAKELRSNTREAAKEATFDGAAKARAGTRSFVMDRFKDTGENLQKMAGGTASFIKARTSEAADTLNDMRGRVAAPFAPANPLPNIRSFASSLIGPKTKEALAKKKRPKTAITGKGTTAPHKKMAGAY